MRHTSIFSIATAAAVLLGGVSAWAGEDMNPAAMAKALQQASVQLEKATKVSEREGKPISAKYEIEHGALQLSIYTMKGDRFSEVVVNHTTGAVAKDEWITDADDLKAAKAQAAARSAVPPINAATSRRFMTFLPRWRSGAAGKHRRFNAALSASGRSVILR